MLEGPHIEYQISTGELRTFDSTGTATLIGTGYAGNGQWLNDPDSTDIHRHGPLPVGTYTIGKPEDHPGSVGDFALSLTPDSDDILFGRAGFFIHGDNSAHDESASDGCIVVDRQARTICSRYLKLEVIA